MKPIINLSDVELKEFGNGAEFEARLGRIGPIIGAQQLGVMLHVVPAGKKAFPKHAHHSNEEMMFILHGTGTYYCGCEHWEVGPGDIISAPAGDKETAHQLVNSSEDELRYLCFSTRKDPEVVEYPDSGKFAVASKVPADGGYLAAGLVFIGRVQDSMDYFEGES